MSPCSDNGMAAVNSSLTRSKLLEGVEMTGLEPVAPCLQSIRHQAACYAAETQVGGEREPHS